MDLDSPSLLQYGDAMLYVEATHLMIGLEIMQQLPGWMDPVVKRA